MNRLKGTFLRSRQGLAACVAVACLGGFGALASLSAGSPASDPAEPRLEEASTAPGKLPPHGQGVPGMSERELLKLETATLGPEHALEHAAMRRSAPSKQPKPENTEKVRQAASVQAAALGERERDRPLGLRRHDHLPDRRDPRRAASHREGDVLLLPAGAGVEELRRGLSVGPGHQRHHAQGPAALARPEGRGREARRTSGAPATPSRRTASSWSSAATSTSRAGPPPGRASTRSTRSTRGRRSGRSSRTWRTAAGTPPAC